MKSKKLRDNLRDNLRDEKRRDGQQCVDIQIDNNSVFSYKLCVT